MHTYGTLSKWNEAQGSGFIAPEAGGDDVYVHMSSMPRDGMRPRIGELLAYEVETGQDGSTRAVNVFRRGDRPSVAAASRQRRVRSAWTRKIVVGLVVVVVAMIAWSFV